jgi:hypothetical protein
VKKNTEAILDTSKGNWSRRKEEKTEYISCLIMRLQDKIVIEKQLINLQKCGKVKIVGHDGYKPKLNS